MTFTLAWIDQDQEARNRVHELLGLFNQPGSRDEMGLGAIRDAFSNLLFPVEVVAERLRQMVTERLPRRFHDAGVVLRASARGEVRSGQTDQRWYWVAPAMLDRVLFPGVRDWVTAEGGWTSATSDGAESWGFRRHVAEFGRVMAEQADPGEPLGAPPRDLFQVLALLALAGPGVRAHRALRRVADMPPTSPGLLAGASRIAHGLRGTFNMPECISLIRAIEDELKQRTAQTTHSPTDHHTRYWELVLRYALAGNLQAVLDEYAHVLEESLGLMDHSDADRVNGISKEMVEALSIRTSQVRIDDIRCAGPGTPIEMSPFNMRTRFALRFGDRQSERGESVQRRSGPSSSPPPQSARKVSISTPTATPSTTGTCRATPWTWSSARDAFIATRATRCARTWRHGTATRPIAALATDRHPPPAIHWKILFRRARDERPPGASDLVPYWIFEHGDARVERRVPLPPYSSEVDQLRRLLGSLAVYRLAFGQPRKIAASSGPPCYGRSPALGRSPCSSSRPPPSTPSATAPPRSVPATIAPAAFGPHPTVRS